MPHVLHPLRLPQGILADHELQVLVLDPRRARDPPVLHLDKVALEEADLVLLVGARRVVRGAHHAEVVKDLALVDGGRRLRDQLGAAHRLAVPVGRVVERQARALDGGGVGRVLVVRGEVDVGGRRVGAVDVPLVGADLVGPGPVVELGRGGEVVEAAVPEDGGVGDGREEGREGGGELHRGGRWWGGGSGVGVEGRVRTRVVEGEEQSQEGRRQGLYTRPCILKPHRRQLTPSQAPHGSRHEMRGPPPRGNRLLLASNKPRKGTGPGQVGSSGPGIQEFNLYEPSH